MPQVLKSLLENFQFVYIYLCIFFAQGVNRNSLLFGKSFLGAGKFCISTGCQMLPSEEILVLWLMGHGWPTAFDHLIF